MINICFNDVTYMNLNSAGHILKENGIDTDLSDGLLMINLQLDMGSISDNGLGDIRLDFMKKLYKSYIFGEDVQETYDGGFGRSVRAVEKLKAGILDGDEFRIWYTEDSSEYCSFCWLICLFEDMGAKNKIYGVKLPMETSLSSKKYKRNYCSASYSPEKLSGFVRIQKTLSESCKEFHAKQWERAQSENTNLRIVLHGNIVSVSDDFYDSSIMIEADKHQGIINEAEVVGECMSKLGLSDKFVGARIDHMIDNGVFEVISRPAISAPFYCKKIMKV